MFAPFHYGYWETGGGPGPHPTAANELTLTEWDPVSKQPMFKNAAVAVEKIGDATGPAPAPTTTASRPATAPGAAPVPPTTGGDGCRSHRNAGRREPAPRFPDAINAPQGGRP